jgi:hypothetical protein
MKPPRRVLAHGYALNHTALSVHRMRGLRGFDPQTAEGLAALAAAVSSEGRVAMNMEGGLVKASPDGGLLQAATMAEAAPRRFACGGRRAVAGAYLEFVLRLPAPGAAVGAGGAIGELQRRDGFEASNADRIFESTSRNAAASGSGGGGRGGAR